MSSLVLRVSLLVGLFVPSATTVAPRDGVGAIRVGPNVQVSSALSELPHFEIASCTNSLRPSEMLVGSMFARGNQTHVAVYRSIDNGMSWALAFTTEADASGAADPTCAFDGRGRAYFVVNLGNEAADPAGPRLLVYRSDDGGRNWQRPLRLPFIDREWVTMSSVRSGVSSVVIHGTKALPRLGLGLGEIPNAVAAADSLVTTLVGAASEDGEHFDRVASGFSEGRSYIIGMGNGVALADGSIGVTFGAINDRTARVPKSRFLDKTLFFARLPPSAEGWRSVQRIAAWTGDARSSGTPVPQLAIDASEGPFKSRLYVVWPDRRSGRVRILLSSSMDFGLTWSEPVTVDDDASAVDPNSNAELANPALAVNRFGVVGVSWLDRRRDPRNLDWDYRMAVSFDGGETFSKSAIVSSGGSHFGGNEQWPLQGTSARRPGTGDVQLTVHLNGFFESSGHTVGMTTDAEGAFHPAWADNRTGCPQVWTTAVQVTGTAHPATETTGLRDVSMTTKFEITDFGLDRRANLLSVGIRLKNEGREPLGGKLLARVRSISSQIGSVSVLDATNGLEGAGAVLDLSDLLEHGSLAAGQTSKEKRLRFRLDQPNPLVPDEPWLLTYGVLSLRLGLYASPDR